MVMVGDPSKGKTRDEGGGGSRGDSPSPKTPVTSSPEDNPNSFAQREYDRRTSSGGGGSSSSQGSWDINQAVNNRVAYLEKKFGVQESDLNRANIQADLEAAHARGVYGSSSDVESSGQTSRQEVSMVREFQAKASELNQIRTGRREATAQELKEFRGSLDPAYVSRRERELEVQNYAQQYPGSYRVQEVPQELSQSDKVLLAEHGVPSSYIDELNRRRISGEDYSRLKKYGLTNYQVRTLERKSVYVRAASGQGFTYKGEVYYSRAAGEKIVELKEAGLYSDVTRRRELIKDFQKYGGMGPEGEPLLGGIYHNGKAYFGSQAADIVADLEKEGKVKVKTYLGGMEIDEGKPNTLPMIFGAPSSETSKRLADLEASEKVAAYEQSRLLGLDMNPFNEVPRESSAPSVSVRPAKVPEGIAVEGFKVAGTLMPDKFERAGLEWVEKPGPNKEPQYTLEPAGWPADIRSLGFVSDSPLVGPVMERWYSERRALEREYRVQVANNPERIESLTRWRNNEVKARGLEAPSIGEAVEYVGAAGYRISPLGLGESVLSYIGASHGSPLYSWSGSRLSELGSVKSEESGRYWFNRPEAPSGKAFTSILRSLGMEATKAESWGKRLEEVDLPYIDVSTTLKGDVMNLGGIVGAAVVTGGLGISSVHAAVRSGAFLAGAAVMPPVSREVTLRTGDKFLGMLSGIGVSMLVANPELAGRLVNRFVTGPIERAVSPNYIPADEIGEHLSKVGGYEGMNTDLQLKPVHTDEISRGALIGRFADKESITVHVTSSPEWNIAEGEKILLKGYPEMAKGFRKSYDLLDFYRSLPDNVGRPQAYLAYLQDIVPEDYAHSELLERFELFGSKNQLLIERSPVRYFRPLSGESLMEYSERTGQYSGQTFLAPENLYGLSVERQAVTPAAYRGARGVEYPGTVLEKTRDLGFTYYWNRPEVPDWISRIPGGSQAYETIFSSPVKLYLTETRTVVPLAERASPTVRMGRPTWFRERTPNIREVTPGVTSESNIREVFPEDISPSVRIISGSEEFGSSSSRGGLLGSFVEGSVSRSRSRSPSASFSGSGSMSGSPSASPSQSMSRSPSQSRSSSPSRSLSPSSSSSQSRSLSSSSSSPSPSPSPSMSSSSRSASPSSSPSQSPQYSASRMSRSPRPPDVIPFDIPTPRRRRKEVKTPGRRWVKEEIPLPGMEAEDIFGLRKGKEKRLRKFARLI
jgi:hypothetical protein